MARLSMFGVFQVPRSALLDRALKSRWLGVVLVILLLAVFAWELGTAVPFVIDDAYITFSFSKNLARGAGPVYGHGVKVEGYSNFLWMVMVAAPLRFWHQVDPIVLARIIAVPFAALLLTSTYLLARTSARRGWSAGAALLLAMDVDVSLGFQSGLETVPYVALIVTGFLLYVRGARSLPARCGAIAMFTAAALMRIDGFIPLGFIVLFEAGSSWAGRRFSLFALLRWALPGVAVWLMWFAWRWRYYGLPLPSPYYAKALVSQELPYLGYEYVFTEVTSSGLFLGLFALGYLVWRRHRAALALGWFALLQLAYAIRVGGDWMPSARFVLPAAPLLLVLCAWAAEKLLAAARGTWVKFAAVGGLACGFVFIAMRLEPHVSNVGYVLYKIALAKKQVEHVSSLKRAASYLTLAIPPGARLVTDYGGVMAYYTQAAPIEMWGLSNSVIATRGTARGVYPAYGRTCPECYPELDPEYFHTVTPLIRPREAFSSHLEVVEAVWQSDTIGRYVDLGRGFISGRVVNLASGNSVWFLERFRAGSPPRSRTLFQGMAIEYPFLQNRYERK